MQIYETISLTGDKAFMKLYKTIGDVQVYEILNYSTVMKDLKFFHRFKTIADNPMLGFCKIEKSTAKMFNLFMPEGMMLNRYNDESIPMEYVATVFAQSFNDAWVLCQNDINKDYAQLNIRSASVGDVFECEGEKKMVDYIGFKTI